MTARTHPDSKDRQKERHAREAVGSIDLKPVENKLAATFRQFLPYLWPPVLHVRLLVMGALFFLVASRLVNMAVPIVLGWSVDALTPKIWAWIRGRLWRWPCPSA